MILDPYSGPRGWSEGLRTLGLTDIGIEIDAAACATAVAAGHRTIRADVARFPLDHLAGRVDGLIMSPPCQAFSTAGKGEGRDAIDELRAAIAAGDWGWHHDDERVRHVLEVGRWAETLRPTWIACEQVPPVLPLWATYAERWRHRYGWSTWAGILNAADFGVPQTRRRAFLIARRRPTRRPARADALPRWCAHHVRRAQAVGVDGRGPRLGRTAPALHDARHASRRRAHAHHAGSNSRKARAARIERGEFVLDRRQQSDGEPVRLVDCDTEPAPTLNAIAGAKSQWVLNPGVTDTQPNRRQRPLDEPAPTVAFGHDSANWAWERPATAVCGDPRLSPPGYRGRPDDYDTDGTYTGARSMDEAIRLTIRDALILQGFPADYPVQGTRTKQFTQIGNAVPPPLAAAVISAVTGAQLEAAA